MEKIIIGHGKSWKSHGLVLKLVYEPWCNHLPYPYYPLSSNTATLPFRTPIYVLLKTQTSLLYENGEVDYLHVSLLLISLHIEWRLGESCYSAGGSCECCCAEYVEVMIAVHSMWLQYVREEAFFLLPFWYRLLYMVPMFMIFRNRLYIAWLASECMCITAGLGLYPAQSKPKCGQGPTDFKALEKW